MQGAYLFMNKGNNVLLIWPDREKGFYNFDPVGLITGQKTMFFPLPLIYVAAALGEEWNYTLVDEGVEPLHEKQLQNADFYLISVNLSQRFATENIIQRLLPYNKPIVIGGPLIKTLDHIFCHPRISKVYGEIEACETSQVEQGTTIAELLAHDMKTGTLKREYHAKGHPDIKKNKPPRYDLVKSADYFLFSMQTSRGCPHHCDFCQQVAFYGNHRRKSNEQVMKELDSLLKLSENRTVLITDDNLMGDINNPEKKQEFIDLLNAFLEWQKKNDYPFDFCTQCSLEVAGHEDIVELMSKIGLNMMFIGIESVDETALTSVHKKQNLEKDMIAQIRILQRYGMGIYAGVIIGFDNESESSIRKQIEFIKKSHIPFIAPMTMFGFPGTKLYKRLLTDNRISSDLDALTKPFYTNVIPLIHPQKMYGYYLQYLQEIYNPKEYFSRCIAWITEWNDAFVLPGKKGSLPLNARLRRISRSFIYQGILSEYRFEYLKYILKTIIYFRKNFNKLSLALFLGYMFQLLYNSTNDIAHFVRNLPHEIIDEWESRLPENANK